MPLLKDLDSGAQTIFWRRGSGSGVHDGLVVVVVEVVAVRDHHHERREHQKPCHATLSYQQGTPVISSSAFTPEERMPEV